MCAFTSSSTKCCTLRLLFTCRLEESHCSFSHSKLFHLCSSHHLQHSKIMSMSKCQKGSLTIKLNQFILLGTIPQTIWPFGHLGALSFILGNKPASIAVLGWKSESLFFSVKISVYAACVPRSAGQTEYLVTSLQRNPCYL